jgi:hypothetical protein
MREFAKATKNIVNKKKLRKKIDELSLGTPLLDNNILLF